VPGDQIIDQMNKKLAYLFGLIAEIESQEGQGRQVYPLRRVIDMQQF